MNIRPLLKLVCQRFFGDATGTSYVDKFLYCLLPTTIVSRNTLRLQLLTGTNFNEF